MFYRNITVNFCVLWPQPDLSQFRITLTSDGSDIHLPYGRVERLDYYEEISNPLPPLKNRKRLHPVIWIASNCKTFSKREAYVHELAKHINVKVYGKCSPEKSYIVPFGNIEGGFMIIFQIFKFGDACI